MSYPTTDEDRTYKGNMTNAELDQRLDALKAAIDAHPTITRTTRDGLTYDPEIKYVAGEGWYAGCKLAARSTRRKNPHDAWTDAPSDSPGAAILGFASDLDTWSEVLS